MAIYYLLVAISKLYSLLFFGLDHIIIITPYGKLLVPKKGYASGARPITMALDVVEPQWKPYFETMIKDADWFLDIGAASDGYYTLKAVRLNPKIKVIAIEPLKKEYYYLFNNLILNNIYRNVKSLNVALCREEKETEIEGEKVRCVTLKDLGELKGRGVIKLDVEGAAYDILHNFLDYICNLKPVIFLEIHNEQEVKLLFMLKSCGYKDIKKSGGMHILI